MINKKQTIKKTPISYYGGKQMMLPRILPIIPQHKIYVEAFFGGGAVFWSKDAVKLILKHDTPDTFFYLDPPYVDSNQGHYGGYMQEHFNELLETLRTIKGKFLLSSYPNTKLKDLTDSEGWNSIGNNLPLSASATAGKRKIEMLTFNYDLNDI